MTAISLSSIPNQPIPFSWDAGSVLVGGFFAACVTDAFFRVISGCGANTQTVVNGANLMEMVTGAVYWTDSIGLLTLGSYAAAAQALGYGATSITCLFGSSESWRAFTAIPADAEHAALQQTKNLLNLGNRITRLAWAILALAAFFVGTPVLPLVTSILFATSFLLLAGSGMATFQLSRLQTV